MWLAALRREDRREDLTDELVRHALWLVTTHEDAETLTRRGYVRRRDALVARDREIHGEAGVLGGLLPTGNQILAHCGLRWAAALRLAGMTPAVRQQHGPARKPPPQRPGMPVAQLIAIFAALNGSWPSAATLWRFASTCNARMANPGGPMAPRREEAAALLREQGIEPPTRTRGGGKVKRMSYRFPTLGIPGAPPRNRRPRAGDDTRPTAKRRLYDEERRAFAVLSLRVWLASLPADGRAVRSHYVAWQVGTDWTTASVFDEGLGGFSALKQKASDENARLRRAGGDPLVDALAEAGQLRASRTAAAGADGATLAPSRAADPDPVPFADALRAVLAGPTAEAQPPKQ